jgi:nucleotide-binding universal stress UspA family protein
MKYQQQLRSRKLHALAESIDHPDAVQEVIVTRGSARDAIPAYATEHGADLIIVSSHHGPYGLKVLLGAAVDGILQRAPCDVLVVHAEATAG